MQITKTALDGVVILSPKKFGDDRGFFSETYNRKALADAGIDLDFVQDNQSLSVEVGVVRGLHFQTPPFAQDKLVRVVRGRILDAFGRCMEPIADPHRFCPWLRHFGTQYGSDL